MSRDEELTRQYIAEATQYMAKGINHIQIARNRLMWAFERNPDWDCSIEQDVIEGAEKLGYALATLVRWYDDDDEGKA
jgi:hypothetical protein